MHSQQDLAKLSDDQLIDALHDLVAHDNRNHADLIRHLAEVDSRKLHLARAFPSMHSYCTRGLGFDDAAAYNRIHVARLARRVPAALDWLARGRIHLTGLRLLAPHLTEHNQQELLEAAAGKTKRQLEVLLAERAPKPDVPDCVRKRPRRGCRTCPGASSPSSAGVRELTPDPVSKPTSAVELHANDPGVDDEQPRAQTASSASKSFAAPSSTPAASRDKAEPRAADRYKIEFTGSAALVDRLERVQALMAHRVPGCGYEIVVEQALELLEAKLLKERFGVGAKPREASACTNDNKTTRYVPAAVRRELYERDGLACAYVDPASGRRCGAAAVQIQHHRAYALGGEHSADNTSLFCAAHNQYAARKDFGQAHVEAAAQRERARREARKVTEPAAPPRAPTALPTAAARPTTAAQLGLFGS